MYPLVDTDLPVACPIQLHFPFIFERYFQIILIVNYVLYHLQFFFIVFSDSFILFFMFFLYLFYCYQGLALTTKTKGSTTQRILRKWLFCLKGKKALVKGPSPQQKLEQGLKESSSG